MLSMMAKLCPKLKVLRVSRQSVLAMLASVFVLAAVSQRPFSLLFPRLHDKQALRQVALRLNTQRTQAALDLLQLMIRRTPQELRTMSQPGNSTFRFVVAIITVGRQKPSDSPRDLGYVLQSAASVISLVRRKAAFRDSFIFLCNVDPHPDNHADAVILKELLPYVDRYGSSTIPNVTSLPIPGTEQLYRDTKHTDSFEKERHDYMFCLDVARRYSSQYYLILQDDAVLHEDFSAVLELSLTKLTKAQTCLHHHHNNRSLLNHLLPSLTSCLSHHPPYSSRLESETQRTVSPSPNSSFAFIKFYFPERWQGFSYETVRLLDLASLGAVGGGLGILFQAVWSRKCKKTFQPSWKAFVLGIAIFLLICYLAGRQNLNELRRISKFLYRFQKSPGCCIPAMLYPAPVMPFLITWLADSPPGSLVDLRISECFEFYQVPGYYIEPNLVHHVGMVSSLPKMNKPVEEYLFDQG